jgi:FMN reductase
MEFIVRALRGWAVPLVIPVAKAWRVFDREGHITDPDVEGQLLSLGGEVVRSARQFHTHGHCDYAADQQFAGTLDG